MKPTVLIIGRTFHPDGKETARQIAGALKPYLAAKNVETEFLHYQDILFDIGTEGVKIVNALNGQELSTYAVVLQTNWFSHASIRKDIAFALALYFEHNKVPYFNTEARFSRSTSKLSQMIIAAYNDVPIPRTIFSLKLSHVEKYLQNKKFATPFIFKDAQASRGHGNYLLQDVSEISKYASEHTEKSPFMVQAKVASDGSDYRFFMTNGYPVAIIKRISGTGSHLNNTSRGSITEVIDVADVPQKSANMAKSMSDLLHREVTGIDIMFDRQTGEPYFLEANPIPQIATGSHVELKLEALANALTERIRQ